MQTGCHQVCERIAMTTPTGGAPLNRRGAVDVTSVAELYQRQAGLNDSLGWL